MKLYDSVTLMVSYRFDAGANRAPSWKALRCWIKSSTLGNLKTEWTQQLDIVKPVYKGIDQVIKLALERVDKITDDVIVEFSSMINQAPRHFHRESWAVHFTEKQ